MKRSTSVATFAVAALAVLSVGSLASCSKGTSSSSSTTTAASNSSSASKGLLAVVSPTIKVSASDPTTAELDVIITNGSTGEDTLTAVSVPSSFASKATVASTPIASGALASLSGATAVQLTGVSGSPKAGSTVPVTFTFSGVGDLVVTATVK